MAGKTAILSATSLNTPNSTPPSHTRPCAHPDLCSADVAGGLVTPDVLFACLHGHAQRRLACRINADANDATRQQALVLIVAGQEGGVGTTWGNRTG